MLERQSFIEYASAARTTAQIGSLRSGRRVRGLIIYLDITALTATGTLTVSVKGYTAAGNAVAFFTAAAAAGATGRFTYILSPDDMLITGSEVTEVRKLPVPVEFTVDVAHGNGVSITYSLKVETF